MFTALVLAGALLASPHTQSDKWDIKAGLAPKTTTTWNVSTSVAMGGEQHNATLKFVLQTKEQDGTKPLPATISWKDLTMEGGQTMDDSSWDVSLDPHGMIVDTKAQEGVELVSRMLAPNLFVYPDTAVGVGDKWTGTIKVGSDKNDQSITADMKADLIEKVGLDDALKVTETIFQKGDDGLKGTGTWWVSKSGQVLKFEIQVGNWEVMLLPGTMLDATLKGELAK